MSYDLVCITKFNVILQIKKPSFQLLNSALHKPVVITYITVHSKLYEEHLLLHGSTLYTSSP